MSLFIRKKFNLKRIFFIFPFVKFFVLKLATNFPINDFFSLVPPTPVEDAEELFPLLLKIDPRELKIFAKLLNIL